MMGPNIALVALVLLVMSTQSRNATEEEQVKTGTQPKTPPRVMLMPSLPPGTKASIGNPIWGKEVNGLQAGISFSYDDKAPHRYRNGDVAHFYVVLRNVSQKPITIIYAEMETASDSNLAPSVLDEKGRDIYLDVEALNGFLVSSVGQKTFAPGEPELIWLTSLKIGPLGDGTGPALSDILAYGKAQSGRYKISYKLHFDERKPSTNRNELNPWAGELETAPLEFEVVESGDRQINSK